MVKRLKSDKDGWGRRLFQSWLNRRIPPVSRLALSHKNVFILPSRTGWAFAGLLLAMLLTAINYQNSLIYGLTFWLVSLGHGTIWLTFRNLSGLEMSAGKVEPCYAGESLQLPLNVSSAKHWSVAITVGYPGETEQDFTLSPGESLDVAIARARAPPARGGGSVLLLMGFCWCDLSTFRQVPRRQVNNAWDARHGA